MDHCDKILDTFDASDRGKFQKYISFFVQLAYCCPEMLRFSTVAIAIAALRSASALVDDHFSATQHLPAFLMNGQKQECYETLQALCSAKGYFKNSRLGEPKDMSDNVSSPEENLPDMEQIA